MRGITRAMITDTVKYGQKVHRQGLEFFIMVKKCLRPDWPAHYASRVLNTTVILGQADEIVTVYKNSKALKQIKKKRKRLS